MQQDFLLLTKNPVFLKKEKGVLLYLKGNGVLSIILLSREKLPKIVTKRPLIRIYYQPLFQKKKSLLRALKQSRVKSFFRGYFLTGNPGTDQTILREEDWLNVWQ